MKGRIHLLSVPFFVLVTLHGTLIQSQEWEFMQYLLASQLITITAILFYHRQQNSNDAGFSLRKKHFLIAIPLVLIAFIGMGIEFERGVHSSWADPVRSFVSAENDWIVASTMIVATLISLIGLYIDGRNT